MPGDTDSDEDEDENEGKLARANTEDDIIEKGGKQKEQKKKVRKNRVGKSYPTQYMKVGEIHCIFLSCFNKGRSPFLSLGPSWPFTLFLLLLACLILGYFCMMLKLAKDGNYWHMLWCEICIFANLLTLLGGILKNPGIPQKYIDRILKDQQGKGEEDDELEM